jgi:hypothetical protein
VVTTVDGAPRINGSRLSPTPAPIGRWNAGPSGAQQAGGDATRPMVADQLFNVDDLDTAVRRAVQATSLMRQLFYCVVLLVALAGQVSGAVEALGIPLLWAIPAVAALELGGIVVLANADVRRRLGERATASRVLSASIAGFAVAFNWMAHGNKLLAGFFAGMSALGYLVWLMHTENQRRDRLRATGDLPPTTPAYEVVGHWVRHPWLTLRAKNLAKADARLGLYTSLAAARAEKRKEVRTKAIAKVLHRKIRAAVDPTTADIAVAVYDLHEIAVRLADGADYDGLTALIAPSDDGNWPSAAGHEAGPGEPGRGGSSGAGTSTSDDAADLRDASARTRRQTQAASMWAIVQGRRDRGQALPSAAELDRLVGSVRYAATVAGRWLQAGAISEEEYLTVVKPRRRHTVSAAAPSG